MAESADLGLILLQFFIIAFLKHQVFPLHVLPDASDKIFRQGDAAQVGCKAGKGGRPHVIALNRGKEDAGGYAHQGGQTDDIQQDPGLMAE